MMRYYPALLRKAKGAGWSMEFPDFPGCVSAGRTVEEAARLGEDALALHVDGIFADHGTVPEPSAAGKLAKHRSAKGAMLVFVPLKAGPARYVRLTISIEEQALADIDRAAEERGMTRAGFMAAAARKAIEGTGSTALGRLGAVLGIGAERDKRSKRTLRLG